VNEFLDSIVADKDWTKVANEEQFKKVLTLMSDYYGMNERHYNKYERNSVSNK
jgi:hypothetical protein